jgi:hypothetical protein
MGDSPAAARDASSLVRPATGSTKVDPAESAPDQGQRSRQARISGSPLRSSGLLSSSPRPRWPHWPCGVDAARARGVRQDNNKAVNSGNTPTGGHTMTVPILTTQSRLGSRHPDHLSAGQAAVLGAAGVIGAPTVRTSALFTIVLVAANPLVSGMPASRPEGVGRGDLLAGPRPAGPAASR